MRRCVDAGVEHARSHQESVRFVWHGLRMVQEVDPDHVRSDVYSPDAPARRWRAWT